jgi:hypothetical protein
VVDWANSFRRCVQGSQRVRPCSTLDRSELAISLVQAGWRREGGDTRLFAPLTSTQFNCMELEIMFQVVIKGLYLDLSRGATKYESWVMAPEVDVIETTPRCQSAGS